MTTTDAITIDELTEALTASGHTVEWPVTGHLLLDGVEVPRTVVDYSIRHHADAIDASLYLVVTGALRRQAPLNKEQYRLWSELNDHLRAKYPTVGTRLAHAFQQGRPDVATELMAEESAHAGRGGAS